MKYLNDEKGLVQLTEQSFPTPEVRDLNPVIGSFLDKAFIFCQHYWKNKNKEKEALNGPLKNNERYVVLPTFVIYHFTCVDDL